MPYDRIISRTDAAALIPEQASREIIAATIQESVTLRFFRRLQNMATSQTRLPVLSLFPTAYFVNGDTGLKRTTEVNWENKYINAEEIAVIVPIPEAVLDDAGYDIWAEVRPRLVEAFASVIDAAVFFGTNAPATWPDSIKTAATAAGNNVALGNDLYADLLGPSGVIAKLEADGYFPNGHVASINLRGMLRALRSTTNEPIFWSSMQGSPAYMLDGAPIEFPRFAEFQSAVSGVYLFSADFSQFVYSIRQDITYKVLSEAVIQDAAGNIVYNLAQQDMVALRASMRLGWQCPNPINRLRESESARYPAAILTT